MELTYGDPCRVLKTAQNVEFLQLRGIEDKPGLQVHLHAIVECLFGLASRFFMLLSEDIGVGSVDGQIGDDLFPRGLFVLREVAPVKLEGFSAALERSSSACSSSSLAASTVVEAAVFFSNASAFLASLALALF
jgi:hypothetical protein